MVLAATAGRMICVAYWEWGDDELWNVNFFKHELCHVLFFLKFDSVGSVIFEKNKDFTAVSAIYHKTLNINMFEGEAISGSNAHVKLRIRYVACDSCMYNGD